MTSSSPLRRYDPYLNLRTPDEAGMTFNFEGRRVEVAERSVGPHRVAEGLNVIEDGKVGPAADTREFSGGKSASVLSVLQVDLIAV